MKKITILLLSVLSVIAIAKDKYKINYVFPENMPEHVKAEYIKQCDKGKILYDLNCAGCHNYKVKNKILIPDFSQEQLIGYELRVMNARHDSSLAETTVTAEELVLINTFLTYKEKNK